jgi:tryptophan 7-halogenase
VFPIMSWLSVMIGQNIVPRSYDPLVDSLDPHKIHSKLEELRTGIDQSVAAMRSHGEFLHARQIRLGR